MNIFYKLWRLPSRELALQLEAACRLTQCVACLKLLGFRRTLAVMESTLRRQRNLEHCEETVDTSVLAVDRAARALRTGTCLSRSLALYSVLRRRGIETRLRIGFNTASADRGICAHAWLEHDGKALDAYAPGYEHVFPPIGPTGFPATGVSTGGQ